MACLGAVIVRDSADTEGRATTGDRMTPPGESLDCRCRSVWAGSGEHTVETHLSRKGVGVSPPEAPPANILAKHDPGAVRSQLEQPVSTAWGMAREFLAQEPFHAAPHRRGCDETGSARYDDTPDLKVCPSVGAFADAHVSGRYSAYSRRAAVTHDRSDTGWSSVSAEVRRNRPGARFRARDLLKLYICPATT